MEKWIIVPETNGMYQVSNAGNIKSFKSGEWMLLKPYKNKGGYLNIDLRTNSKRNSKRVSILVATYFVDNPHNHKIVNHEDGNKTNNNDWNLKWGTQSYNVQHAWDTGLKKKRYGENNHNSILTQLQADEIRLLRKQKVRQKKLCEMFNISRATCQRILYNKIYLSL